MLGLDVQIIQESFLSTDQVSYFISYNVNKYGRWWFINRNDLYDWYVFAITTHCLDYKKISDDCF